ncbi:MAG: hypothetical protein PVJ57_10200 [Phycisphaerae bacterium]
MLRVVRWLQSADRRLVYLLLVAVLSVPFVVTYSLPIHPDTYTQKFYDQIERIAADPVERDKVVLFLTNWGPGTSGENEPQFNVLVRHLLRRRLKFIFICSMGPPEFHDAAMAAFERAREDEVQRAWRRGEPIPTWVYGEDYLDFGYTNAPVFASQARSIITRPREIFGRDYVNDKDLLDDASYPLLARFHGLADVSAVITCSAGDESRYIAGLVRGEFPSLLIGPATLGIEANRLYPYVKSNQLFGLLNSARAATEYRSLLDPDEPMTRPIDNSMSLGKSLLLLLVLVGNVALLTTRWAERSGRLPRLDPRKLRPPLPPLPRWFMWTLFGAFVLFYGGSVLGEVWRHNADDKFARLRVARPDDEPGRSYPRYERVGRDDLLAEVQAVAAESSVPALATVARLEADRRYAQMIESRIGEFIMAFLTLGVFAFLLGDNRFYRFIEAIIIGGALAYLLDQVNEILRPDWIEPMLGGFTGARHWTNALWLLLLVPGALWYFAYSKRYRWLNQLVVAAFIGLMIGPEFENQPNLVIPQILDTIQPVWPWVTDTQTGVTTFDPARLEHLVFVAVAVLSLAYFVFIFRPRSAVGRGTISAGRMAMMIGFGAMFGNTVNTRLSWLAPRIGFLIEDWLGKLWG